MLSLQGYDCIGPTLNDGAVVYRPVTHVDQFPLGIFDVQAAGEYRYEQSSASARQFSWANGAQCLKPLVFKPREVLWQSIRTDSALSFDSVLSNVRPTAVIGVRACDLAALALSDAHFLHGEVCDQHYKERREKLLLIAVNCTHPSANCFCASTGDGPTVVKGADLVLDELDEGFAVSVFSQIGEQLIEKLTVDSLTSDQHQSISMQRASAVTAQSRSVPFMKGKLSALAAHTKWQEIAQQCLSCGNCTAVCPSCFCHSQTSQVSLDLEHVEQSRQWDSCFNTDHSYIHGFVVRAETSHRYRQWLTHKFDYWHEQYGRSGCTGCGRCITWCPVGIDVTKLLNEFSEIAHE
ncbi:MAG: 4Fe-4S dicluster domain-containing protein [Gammaproteobacteria bacterium]|nr:4Fe-4S dicluster domain-containing protein [Gammaproteobacteria bacterium]